jgi:hypothetical protein
MQKVQKIADPILESSLKTRLNIMCCDISLQLNKKVDKFQLCLIRAASLFLFSCVTYIIADALKTLRRTTHACHHWSHSTKQILVFLHHSSHACWAPQHSSITALSIMTLIIMTFSIITLSIMIIKHESQHYDTQYNYSVVMLSVIYAVSLMLSVTFKPFMLSVVILSAVAPLVVYNPGTTESKVSFYNLIFITFCPNSKISAGFFKYFKCLMSIVLHKSQKKGLERNVLSHFEVMFS